MRDTAGWIEARDSSFGLSSKAKLRSDIAWRPTPRIRTRVVLGAVMLALLGCATATTGSMSETGSSAPEIVEAETSVKPGINESYLDADLDVDAMVARFEVESREVAARRDAIVAAVGLQPGMSIADIGAGTGLFMEPFASAVGSAGEVYAVDIAEPFIEHLAARAADADLPQVRPTLCTEDSVELPAGSIDLAFVCDTYHHFEYPRSTVESIHRALRPNGELFIVDFERIPGVSRDWILGHVRAGRDEVIAEIESFGFDLVEEELSAVLDENYALRFRRRPNAG